MINKIQNLKDLEHYANMLELVGVVKKWNKAKPDNPDLKKVINCIANITMYIATLQNDLAKHKMAMSDYRYEKNKALLELQELTKKNNEYEI